MTLSKTYLLHISAAYNAATMGTNFWIFVSSVWHHWEPLVLGGAVGVFIFVYEHRKKEPIPWRKIGYIMAAVLLVSCFLAWQDQFTSTEWRGTELSRLNGLMQGKEEQIKILQNQLMFKDRPVVLQYATDPEITKMLNQQNQELAKLKNALPSPKKKALELSNDMVKFSENVTRNQPRLPIIHDAKTKEEYEARMDQFTQGYQQWMLGMAADYQRQFAVRIASLEDDVKAAGLTDSIEGCQYSNGNTFMMQRCGALIGALAGKLPR